MGKSALELSLPVEGYVPPNLGAPILGRNVGTVKRFASQGQQPSAETIMPWNFIALLAHTLWFQGGVDSRSITHCPQIRPPFQRCREFFPNILSAFPALRSVEGCI